MDVEPDNVSPSLKSHIVGNGNSIPLASASGVWKFCYQVDDGEKRQRAIVSKGLEIDSVFGSSIGSEATITMYSTVGSLKFDKKTSTYIYNYQTGELVSKANGYAFRLIALIRTEDTKILFLTPIRKENADIKQNLPILMDVWLQQE